MLYIIGILIVGVALITLYLLRKRYTKERFAFRSFFWISTFSLIVVMPLFGGTSLVKVLEIEILSWLSIDTNHVSSWYDKLLSLLVLLSLVWLAQKIHKNWDGKESIRSHNNAEYSITTTMVQDAIDFIRLHSSEELNEYLPTEDSSKILPEDKVIVEDWRIEALKLLKLLTPQYKVDEANGWHGEYSSYVGSYGSDSNIVIVHCPVKRVNQEELDNVSRLCKKLGITDFHYCLITKHRKDIIVDVSEQFPSCCIYDKNQLLEKIADFNGYREYIFTQYTRSLVSDVSNLTIQDTYTPITGCLDDGKSIGSIDDHIDEWLAESGKRHIAILGEYGQGKSTYCLQLAYRLFKDIEHGDINSRTPIIIELRGKSPRTMEVEEILFTWCRKYGIDPSAMIALHMSGKILLILDGFDEMDFVGEPEIRIDHFRKLWEFARHPNAKIIITGRPNFFLDGNELKRSLLVSEIQSDTPYCTPIRIEKFTDDKILHTLRNFDELVVNSISEIVSKANNNSQLIDLLSRPSTLVWAASVWDELKDDISKVGASSVIGRFIEQSFSRQLDKQLSTTVYGVEREYFTCGIALSMHLDNPGVNQIGKDKLKRTVRELIDTVPEALQDYTSPLENKFYPFSDRIKDPLRKTETVFTDVRTCSVIVEDLSRPGHFKFAHKSFYEYFVGSYIGHLVSAKGAKKKREETISKGIVIAQSINQSIGKSVPILRFPMSDEICQFAAQIIAEPIKESNEIPSELALLKRMFPNSGEFMLAIYSIRSPISEVLQALVYPIEKVFGVKDFVISDPYASMTVKLVAVKLRIWAYLCIEIKGSVEGAKKLVNKTIWEREIMKDN